MFIGKYEAKGQKVEMTSVRLPSSFPVDRIIKILISFGVVLLAVSCQRFYVRAMKVGAATLAMGVSFVAASILLHCCKKPPRIIHFSTPGPREVVKTTLSFEEKKSKMVAGGYSFWIDCFPDKPCKHDVVLSCKPCGYAIEYGAHNICRKDQVTNDFSKTHVTGLGLWKTQKLENGMIVTAVPTGLDDYLAWVITENGTHTYFLGNNNLWTDLPTFYQVKAHFPKLHRVVLPSELPINVVEILKILDPHEIVIQHAGTQYDCPTVGSCKFIILPTGLPGRFSYAMQVDDQVTYIPGNHTLSEGNHIAEIESRLGPIDKIIGNPIKGLNMKPDPNTREVKLEDSIWPKLDTSATQMAFLMFHGFGDKIRI